MRSPYVYLLTHGFKNRFLSKLRRLRQPRYLISALAGIAYLYFVFLRQVLERNRPFARGYASFSPETIVLLETLLSVVLLIALIVPWLRPLARHASLLTEAEVQFLLPAPLSRRSILRFRIIKGQIGILLGVGISMLLVAGIRGPFGTIPVMLTLWVAYSFLGIYRLAVTLFRMRTSGSRTEKERGGGLRILVAAVLLGVLLWTAFARRTQDLPVRTDPKMLVQRISSVIGQPPISYLLAPLRVFVRPAFAPDWTVFASSIVPAIFALWLAYVWVVRSDADLGETPIGAAARYEVAGTTIGRGTSDRARFRRPPFRLHPTGPPHVALFWKNLITSGRIDLRRGILVAFLVILALTAVIPWEHRSVLPAVIGAVAGALTGFLTLMGPVVFRNDFRSDLLNLDTLKTYPIRGWQVALGEIAGPAAQLAALEWVTLTIAAVFLPEPQGASWNWMDRMFTAVGAALLLPVISFIGLLAQNAAALLLPGWVQLGRESQRGVEAMGQRLIATGGTLLVVLLAGMPASGVFGILFVAGYWVIGTAVIPLASVAAAILLVAESWAGVLWLGRLFDGLDPSTDF